MNAPDIFPIVSEEYAASIGHVAISWSMIEGSLKFAVMTLAGHPLASGIALTAELPHLATIALLSTFVNLINEPNCTIEWGRLRHDIEVLRPMRNDVIHAEWRVFGDMHAALRIKARGSATSTIKHMPKDSLDDLAGRIVIVADEIVRFTAVMMQNGAMERLRQATHLPSSNPTKPAQVKVPRPPKQSSAQKRAAREKDGGGEVG